MLSTLVAQDVANAPLEESDLLVASGEFQAVWRNLEIKVHLNQKGDLEVEENHDIILTGLLEGLSFIFPISSHQKVEIKSLELLDLVKNKSTTFKPGPISEKFNYALVGGKKLEFRLRSQAEPLFKEKLINLRLRYTVGPVLRPYENHYQVEYGLGHYKRGGPIEKLTVHFTTDKSYIPVQILSDKDVRKNMPNTQIYKLRIQVRKSDDTSSTTTTDKGFKKIDEIFTCTLGGNLFQKESEIFLRAIPKSYLLAPQKVSLSFRLTSNMQEGHYELKAVGVNPFPVFYISDEERKRIGQNADFYQTTHAKSEAEFKKYLEGHISAILFGFFNSQFWPKEIRPDANRDFSGMSDQLSTWGSAISLRKEPEAFQVYNSKLRLLVNEIEKITLGEIPFFKKVRATISDDLIKGIDGNIELQDCQKI